MRLDLVGAASNRYFEVVLGVLTAVFHSFFLFLYVHHVLSSCPFAQSTDWSLSNHKNVIIPPPPRQMHFLPFLFCSLFA